MMFKLSKKAPPAHRLAPVGHARERRENQSSQPWAGPHRDNQAPLRVEEAMARYYFNLCCDEQETTDVVGEDCADDVAALKQALKAASDVIKKQLFFNKVGDGWIEVEDEHHREVMRLPLRAAAY
jgi:hypothetical protein